MRLPESSAPYGIERRKHVRLPLSCTVYLLRVGAVKPLESRTTNVSVEGFYCCVQEKFIVGEWIRCILVMPAINVEEPMSTMPLHCSATVVRVEPVGAGCGVACQIHDYTVAPITGKGYRRPHTFLT